MLRALARPPGNKGDGVVAMTPHRCEAGRIVDRYRTENLDRKRLQVSDSIQTLISHRTYSRVPNALKREHLSISERAVQLMS